MLYFIAFVVIWGYGGRGADKKEMQEARCEKQDKTVSEYRGFGASARNQKKDTGRSTQKTVKRK